MVYRALADLVVLVHLAFILFALFGGALAFRWSWVPWLQLPAAAWGVAVQLCRWLCPLTPLENALRRASGAAGYSGGFVEHYLIPVIYPADLNPERQLLLGCAVLGANAAIYASLAWRARSPRLTTRTGRGDTNGSARRA
jgi:hypothetical protein